MYSQLSEGEKQFVKESLTNKVRIDGRTMSDFREVEIQHETMLFPNALYGVKVNIPDSKNSILIGLNASVVNLGAIQEEVVFEQEKLFKIEIKCAFD